ncbi:unnamed protein product, partial [Prorocentrum cordatum]
PCGLRPGDAPSAAAQPAAGGGDGGPGASRRRRQRPQDGAAAEDQAVQVPGRRHLREGPGVPVRPQRGRARALARFSLHKALPYAPGLRRLQPPQALRGSRCEELRSTSNYHKTKLCRFSVAGHCVLGTKCNFAHSEE